MGVLSSELKTISEIKNVQRYYCRVCRMSSRWRFVHKMAIGFSRYRIAVAGSIPVDISTCYAVGIYFTASYRTDKNVETTENISKM